MEGQVLGACKEIPTNSILDNIDGIPCCCEMELRDKAVGFLYLLLEPSLDLLLFCFEGLPFFLDFLEDWG